MSYLLLSHFHMKQLRHREIKTILNHLSDDYQHQNLNLGTLIMEELCFCEA